MKKQDYDEVRTWIAGRHKDKLGEIFAKCVDRVEAGQGSQAELALVDYFHNAILDSEFIQDPLSVKIGNQVWTSKNLDIDVKDSWSTKYGRLYTWEAAVKVAATIPEWHLPSDLEWRKLINFCGEKAGLKLKSKAWDGTDEFGFGALPAGSRYSNGSFYSLGYYAYFWTATESYASYAWDRYLVSGYDDVYRGSYDKPYGQSVRLIKN